MSRTTLKECALIFVFLVLVASACETNPECRRYTCVRKSCVPVSSVGGICDDDDDCAPNFFCDRDEGRCTNPCDELVNCGSLKNPVCADFRSDVGHCGGCDMACSEGQLCALGKCFLPWTPLDPFASPRSGMSVEVVSRDVERLADVRVMVAGGEGRDGSLVPFIEWYYPSNNSWVTISRMPTPRQFFGSAMLDGMLYIVGGIADAPLNVTEAYDIEEDRWEKVAELSSPRNGIALVAVDEYLFSIGGANTELVDTVEIYNPYYNFWSLRSPMPSPRGGMACVVIEHRVFVLGGTVPDPSSPTGFSVTSSVLMYDTKADKWTERAPMKTARSAHSAVVINERIFVIGGSTIDANGNEIFLSSVESFDDFFNVWRDEESLPVAVSYAPALTLEDRIFVFGGVSSSSSPFKRDSILVSRPMTEPSLTDESTSQRTISPF